MSNRILKIALASSQVGWGGGEQYLWSLGKNLVQRGHEVTWFLDKSSALAGRVATAGFRLQDTPARQPSPYDLFRIRRVCTKRGIQIFHSNDSHALNWGGIALFGASGIRRIAMKHTAFPIRSAVRYNWSVDVVACVSHSVRKMCIESGITPSKTTVIHGCVEPSTIDRTEAKRWACRALGISEEVPLFSVVGSLLPCKAHHRIVDAASYLRKYLADFRIVICGEGKERGALEMQIQKLGLEEQVKLLGFQTEPDRWIAASNALVHPSVSEGLSLVAIQSQMAGTPVIATDVDGLGEVMRHPLANGELGWIIPREAPEGNAVRLARLMLEPLQKSEERDQRILMAKNSALDRFSVERMVDSFECLYFKLLADTRSVVARQAGQFAT